jgi:uncharacterized OB-fold protein
MEAPLPTLGDVARPFWEAARQGHLVAQRCRQWGHTFLPPRRWCPSCWATALERVPCSGRGRVYSFTVVHQAPSDFFQARAPYVLAIVELEEGPRLMATILGVDPHQVYIDMPVQVTFERRGDMSIPQFMPVGEVADAEAR